MREPTGGVASIGSCKCGGERGDSVDVGPLRTALLDRFEGQEVSLDEINKYVVAETPYASGQWNQKVL